MPSIKLVAFRGLGGVTKEEHPYFKEHGLLRAGHQAMAGIVQGKLIGFSPTPEAIEKLGGEQALFAKLKKHEAVEGCLQDDTLIFKRALELKAEGAPIEVLDLDVEISEQMLQELKAWYTERKISMYNFPDDEIGGFAENEANCATFPARFGIQLPHPSGQMLDYMDAMSLQEGVKPWSGQ